jgi:hypothetical protein
MPAGAAVTVRGLEAGMVRTIASSSDRSASPASSSAITSVSLLARG